MKQNLRAVITHLPVKFQAVVQRFNSVFSADDRGTLLNDMLTGLGSSESARTTTSVNPREFVTLPEGAKASLDEYKQKHNLMSGLESVHCISHSAIHTQGMRLATWSTSTKDCYVALPGEGHAWSAGRVRNIFTCKVSRELGWCDFLLVDVYSALGRRTFDPYQEFPVVGGRLYLRRFSHQIMVAKEDIRCQLATMELSHPKTNEELILAFPLNKVNSKPLASSTILFTLFRTNSSPG